MPRVPKLRKKKIGKTTYWYTEAGVSTYFGNVEEMPYSEARKLFSDHVKSLAEGSKYRNVLSVAELVEKFLEWIEKNRSPLSGLRNFRVWVIDITQGSREGRNELRKALPHCKF